MYIYKISQTVNNDYDTFDSAIVAAESEEDARWICPTQLESIEPDWDGTIKSYDPWVVGKDVQVELIGTALKGQNRGCILASFNAG